MHAIMRYIWHMYLCARMCVCVPELEVARLSTDGNLADLTFPQSEQHGNSLQLSASTLKQHGRNGRQQISAALFLPILKHLLPLQSTPLPSPHHPLVFCLTGNACFLLCRICCYRWDQDGLCTVQEPGLLPVHRERKRETKQWGHLP